MSEFFTTVARPVRKTVGRKREATPFDGFTFAIADENSAIGCPVLVTAETRKLARQLRAEFKSQDLQVPRVDGIDTPTAIGTAADMRSAAFEDYRPVKLQTRFIGHGEDKLQLMFWCE